jgi:hypothetical protein
MRLSEFTENGPNILRFFLIVGCLGFGLNFMGSCSTLARGAEGGPRSSRVLTDTDKGYHNAMMKKAGLGFLVCLASWVAAEGLLRARKPKS